MTAPGARSDSDLVRAPEPADPVADGAFAAPDPVGRSDAPEAVGASAASDSVGASAAPRSVGASAAPRSAGASAASDSVGASVARGSAGASAPATDGSPSRRLVRSIAAAVAAVLAGVAAVLLVRNGIRTNTFPPFLDGTSSTTITRYSGPWLTAGAGAALLAALLLLSAVLDLRRWLSTRRFGRPGGDAPGSPPDVIGATPP